MKSKYHFLFSGVILICLFVFGFTNRTTFRPDKPSIVWSDRPLEWNDFQIVRYIEDGFDASVYSNIVCPKLITDQNSKVYAYMNPNLSERLKDSHLSDDLLVHEQYHFNITEYCARLFRKDIVKKGLGGLSYSVIKSLHEKYAKKCDSFHDVYDRISDHSAETKMQRYWELKIDDLLRQTAYYKNEDIYSYYDFAKNRASFFKHVYFTHTHKILTSFPVSENDIKYGETYEILYNHKEKVVKFYKDGELTNGGRFNSAITKIQQNEKGFFEVYYFNPDETYNTDLSVCIRKSLVDDRKNSIVQYFDKEGKRVEKNSVYETRWQYNPEEESYYASFFDKRGRKITNDEGIYHKKRVLDDKERTIFFDFDKQNKLRNDDNYVARYERQFNENNLKIYYRVYDEDENFAFHLNDYHLAYDYDERGNIIRVTSLDENHEKIYDNNGASIYEYTYDTYDRETGVKRFNKDHLPIIANDDFFQLVKEYDSFGRLTFEAYYYPEYVLKFSDYKWGATKYMYEGDSIIKEYNVDAYNNVFENNNKIAIIKKHLNGKKEVVRKIYLDAGGLFAKAEDEIVEEFYKFDSSGNKTESAGYDSLGKLKEFEEDVAIVRWNYDKNGNKIKTTYFNIDDQLANAVQGVTYNEYKYNDKNQLIERTNFDIEHKPALIDETFKTRFLLNRFGKDSIMYEYDINSKLKAGVSITKYFYNKYGNEIRSEYYDADNRRVKNDNGVSATNYSYNKRQRLVGYSHFDEFNRLTNTQDGVAIEKWKLNDLGHTLTYEYFDQNENTVIGPYGYHRIEYEWDDMGQTTEIRTYGENNLLVEDESGTAIYKYTLAPSGLIQVIERYNDKGILAENSDNVAISHYKSGLNGLYFLEQELNAKRVVVNDTIEKVIVTSE